MQNASIKAKVQEIREILDTFDLSKTGEPQKGDEIHKRCLSLQVLVEDFHADALKPLPEEIRQINGKLSEFERQVTSAAMGAGFTSTISNHEWLKRAHATLAEIERCIDTLSGR